MKYIIALMALSPDHYIQIAQDMFGGTYEHYILSHTSHPHITICQFTLPETTAIQDVLKILKTKNYQVPVVDINGISFTKNSKDIDKDLYWAALKVTRNDSLVHLHTDIKKTIESYGGSVTSESDNLYYPHLTLALTNLPTTLSLWPPNSFDQTQFSLVLGKADAWGQFIELMDTIKI